MNNNLKPSLMTFDGDARVLCDLIEKYEYTNEEVSEIVNIYDNEELYLPEVEHIYAVIYKYPKVKFNLNVLKSLKLHYNRLYEFVCGLNPENRTMISDTDTENSKITDDVKMIVWNRYIGDDIIKHKCLCCKK
jgi:hypothetical protein